MSKRMIILSVGVVLVIVASAAGILLLRGQSDDDEPTDDLPVAADAPLIEMLAIAPASASQPDEEGRVWIAYHDWIALFAARPDFTMPLDWAELSTWMADEDDLRYTEWTMALQRQQELPRGYRSMMDYGHYWQQSVGFEPIDTHQTLVFGVPPDSGIIVRGDFTAEAVGAAHAARDYSQHDLAGGVTMWCGPVGGCEGGLEFDRSPQERDPETNELVDENSLLRAANPFGGHVRQQHPLIAVDNVVASSAKLPRVEQMAATYIGSADSLLDVPSYRALAEALAGQGGAVVQAVFLGSDDPAVNGTRFLSDESERFQEEADRLSADYGPLPAYEVAVLADVAQDEQQVAVVGLVYSDEGDARRAATEVHWRVTILPRVMTRNDQPVLNDVRPPMTLDGPMVEAHGDYWVVLVAARGRVPGADDYVSDDRYCLDALQAGFLDYRN